MTELNHTGETLMGNLVTQTPYSEITATLEVLDSLGVDREGLKHFRKAALHVQLEIAQLMQRSGAIATNPFLRLLPGAEALLLEACGTEMIVGATDVFPGFIDGDFKKWELDVPSEPSPAILTSVYEQVKDGSFTGIFTGFNVGLDRLCLTQAQIRKWVIAHREWLHTEGYGAFFLLKENGKYFVAHVDAGGLKVHVNRLERVGVSRARYARRVVVPQV